jgi:chromosome segregation ATPase
MTTLEDIHKDVKKLTGAVEENGKQLGTQSTQITNLSSEVGSLATSVGEVKEDLKEYRNDSLSTDRRLVAVETRVDERTQPVTADRGNPTPSIMEAKKKVLDAKAKLYIVAAAVLSAGGTALIGWLATR